ncbi:helix-turn-helix domain-containing protein [Cupriavidus gilardii]|uniref:helix-turn-helix domain-containing protein n=1 Tax=Cupriavidus gilardii TaxID=82541 RepID=UPI0015800003|nr:helix-turn-helix domain-containing protein [Cupriavidus gilardii]QKS60868.1 helix-turn-helix domain-containing protein [Cupriavidus gilardii]
MPTPREHLQALIDAGVSQSEIGRKSGVRQATISRILSGDVKDPLSSTVEKLRRVRVPRQKARATEQAAA